MPVVFKVWGVPPLGGARVNSGGRGHHWVGEEEKGKINDIVRKLMNVWGYGWRRKRIWRKKMKKI